MFILHHIGDSMSDFLKAPGKTMGLGLDVDIEALGIALPSIPNISGHWY